MGGAAERQDRLARAAAALDLAIEMLRIACLRRVDADQPDALGARRQADVDRIAVDDGDDGGGTAVARRGIGARQRQPDEQRRRQPRGSKVTRLVSFTVASSVEIDWPSCGWITCGASSASGSSTKRRLCISGCGILSVFFDTTSWS